MSAHSTGPWHWHFFGPQDDWVRTSDGSAVVRVGANRVERESDARLIAAAPELLAALKEACDAVADCKDWERLIARIEAA